MGITIGDFQHQSNSFHLFIPNAHFGFDSWRKEGSMSAQSAECLGPVARVASPHRARRSAWRAATARVAEIVRAVRTRRLLATMDDRLLADIGVSRGEALFEATRAPWDTATARDPSRI
jgi:uncharacterized protein YjiS (DUF1127 family)